MTATQPQVVAPEPVISELKEYLDRVRFQGFYKNLVGLRSYYATPSSLGKNPPLTKLAHLLHDQKSRDLDIALCLSARREIKRDWLSSESATLAEKLVEAGFLQESEVGFGPGSVELIAWNDLYLLLDARSHYAQPDSLNEVYIGIDSYLLGYYLDLEMLRGGGRHLDLCMGTGVIGLLGASVGADVVSTDIAPAPLLMGARNRLLNGFEDRIEIRAEPMEETLANCTERFDVVSCNPPFVVAPEGLDLFQIFAQGPDPDGLGYVRWLFENVWDTLTENGSCAQVALFPGDGDRLHFQDELEELAARRSLAIDIFVDREIAEEAQRKGTTAWLVRLAKDISAEEIAERVAHHFREVLRAEQFFLATIVARRSTHPEVQLLNRYRDGGIMAGGRLSNGLDPIYQRIPVRKKDKPSV
ncbi:MAG: methyltransferase [Candidatus Binatia bacterium]|nr:methyltransferase [Candidatus Binatia bacterium]